VMERVERAEEGERDVMVGKETRSSRITEGGEESREKRRRKIRTSQRIRKPDRCDPLHAVMAQIHPSVLL
jgi:hypothetical protein